MTEAQAKLDRLIEEGNNLFNQARVEEAMAVAESAVMSNPSSVPALSLKALCHERRGEIAEALDAADRIVELNPDSDFDKIRRSALRQKLQAEYHLSDVPDRRIALLGAVGAVVFVVCLGIFLAHMLNGPTARAAEPGAVAANDASSAGTATNSTQGSQAGAPPTGSAPGGSAPAGNGGQPSGAASTPSDPPQTGGVRDGRDDGSTVPPIRRRPAEQYSTPPGGGALPAPDNEVTIAPVSPPEAPRPAVGKPNPDDQNVDPSPRRTATIMETAPAEDPGQITINLHPGGRTPSRIPTGSQSVVSGTGVEALVRVGSQQFELGNFEGAAKSYEQAIQNGGDAIILNRRLGQAYERLGRSSDATGAYRRCISAVDAALASGHGNRDRLMSTRDLCQQALKVLGG